jgi:hypothetical protein
VAGPLHWHISLTGTDDHDQAVQLVIDLDAPTSDIVVAEAQAVNRSQSPLDMGWRGSHGARLHKLWAAPAA